jgi:Uma2 family endonuclease
MAERAKPHGLMSVEEYLRLERDSPVRHEYVGGVLYAMTGASRRHNRIAGNIYRKLADAAGGGPCRTYISDMKVLTPDSLAYYPDVMVACAEEPEDEYLEVEPCLIVEVTSPSSESTDRREKLVAYMKIPSLKTYLVVEQERRHVERYFRDEGGEWHKADLVEEGTIPVPCPPDTELTLAEIYEEP